MLFFSFYSDAGEDDSDDAYNAETDYSEDDDNDAAPAPRHWVPQPRAPPQPAPAPARVNLDDAYKDPVWLQRFAEHVGPTLHNAEHTPWEIFQDLLPQEAINVLVRETNRYAEQYFRSTFDLQMVDILKTPGGNNACMLLTLLCYVICKHSDFLYFFHTL